MKRTKLFTLALMALMLGACTNESVTNDSDSSILPGEKGYISMSINLPTSMKGVKSVEFDDGTKDEYKVKNIKLLLFGGASEAEATCQSIYTLQNTDFSMDASEQITSTATIVEEITRPTGDHLYALIILNDNGLVSDIMIGKELSYFTTTVTNLEVAELNGNGFFMSNAPLFSTRGGDEDPSAGQATTLAEVDANKIYSTKSEALLYPAAKIYVERALSKVSVGSSANGQTDNPKIASYTINGWTLDNTNKKTFLVRNVNPETSSWWGYANDNNWYRFVDDEPLKAGVSYYRTHFGIDPNYEKDCTDEDLNRIKGTIPASELTLVNSCMYCLENTFDVPRMKEKNTTRVIIAATLNVNGSDESNKDFYILNDNTNTIYVKTGVIDEIKRLWMNHFNEIKSDYIKEGTFSESHIEVELSNDGDGEDKDGGFVSVNALTIKDPGNITYVGNQNLAAIQKEADRYISDINNMLKIAYYKGGVAYYYVLIKHFGDEETPWNGLEISGSESYPDTDKERKWLGRYGVLRNTWYKINVTGLRNIGSPEVPEVTEKWDDPLTRYIAVEINILPWAVRTQNVEL